MRSNTEQAIGNALKDQAINTAKNLATDVLTGNPLKEGVKREVHNIRNRAALGIQQLKKKRRKLIVQREKVRKLKLVNPKVRGKGKLNKKQRRGVKSGCGLTNEVTSNE